MSHTPIGFKKTALTKRPGSIFILHGKMTGLHWNAESTIWTLLGAYEREELVGFVIFEPASGDISSLAVAKDYRRKGIGKSLLKSAVSHFQSDVLKFTNVDCDCESVTGFLSSLGLTPKRTTV